MQIQKIVILGSIIASIAFSANAENNNGEKEQASNLEEISCWEVMTLPEADRDFALVLLYGYNAGKQNHSMQRAKKIESTIMAASQICREKPDLNALLAFRDANN